MNISLPPAAELRARLAGLNHAQMQKLASDSGVPFTTLWKIRDGTTKNPGIETVRAFLDKLPELAPAPAPAEVANG